MIISLNHIAIYVKDVELSKQFYREVIGLKEIPRPAFDFEGAWFEIAGEQQLHIIKAGEADLNSYSEKHLWKPRGNHFAIRISSSMEVEKFLNLKKVEYLSPRQRPDGAIQIFLMDPDGYWIELVEIKID